MLLKEKDDIIGWLDKYNVKNYTLIPDHTYGYIVDVAGDIDIGDEKLNEIMPQFGYVTGYFFCSYNRLTTLKGAPKHVGSDFYCSYNELTSLEGAPESVGGKFLCHGNLQLCELQKMESLKEIKSYLLAEKLKVQLSNYL